MKICQVPRGGGDFLTHTIVIVVTDRQTDKNIQIYKESGQLQALLARTETLVYMTILPAKADKSAENDDQTDGQTNESNSNHCSH